MLQCGAEWFFSKNVHNDLSVAYCKTLNQISNAAVAKCESIITFTVSAADSDLWWYNVLSRDDVGYGKNVTFFREINFTKFSWNWFHEKYLYYCTFFQLYFTVREVQRSYFHSTDEEESVFEAMLAGSKLGKGIKGDRNTKGEKILLYY